jgi:hypothetical protein
VALIYSVSVSLGVEDAEEWLAWMRETHLERVMATGCFDEYRLHRLLAPAEDITLVTFNVQYTCADRAAYDRYHREHAAELQAESRVEFGDRAHAFRSLLELLD